jgi:hypothetical protein
LEQSVGDFIQHDGFVRQEARRSRGPSEVAVVESCRNLVAPTSLADIEEYGAETTDQLDGAKQKRDLALQNRKELGLCSEMMNDHDKASQTIDGLDAVLVRYMSEISALETVVIT